MKEKLREIFRSSYNRSVWRKTLVELLGSRYVNLDLNPRNERLTATEQKVAKEFVQLGVIRLEDGQELNLYEITLNTSRAIAFNRVGVNDLVKTRIIRNIKAGALVVFCYPLEDPRAEWRFSFVGKSGGSEYFEDAENKQTNPKRYTYLFGTPETHKTAISRFLELSENLLTLDALYKAFSVEKLSKEFFDEYTYHYNNFVQYLTGYRWERKGNKTVPVQVEPDSPGIKYLKSVFNGHDRDARDFVKKLMGRIVFLYFIQKKGWLGASSTKYNDGPTDFIYNLFRSTGGNANFFPIGLSKLFFDALNRPRPNDDYTIDGETVKIPYLNGGLFNRDRIDEILGSKGDTMTIPPMLFSESNKKEHPYERGFLDFLNAFNFTVHENSEEDQQVAVDPEMLGHIFENLLEDNKEKGAFYTPREIVNYMCQQSLIEYLLTHLSEDYTVYKKLGRDQVELFGGEDQGIKQLQLIERLGEEALDRSEVEYIVIEKDVSKLTSQQLKKIDQLLDTVKICDPAIGSGAFPMGLLQEIFAIKERIAFELDAEWKPAQVKEKIIQESIYGVDIERGAVDIARLRFWLSLVVDLEKPHALPNLDYKILAGNSLVSNFIYKGKKELIKIDWDIEPGKQLELHTTQKIQERQDLLFQITQKQKKFFETGSSKEKEKLKAEIRSLKLDILIAQLQLMIEEEGLKEYPVKSNFNSTAKYQKAVNVHLTTLGWLETLKKLEYLKDHPEMDFEHFDWKIDFPEVQNPILKGSDKGFDIIIANPPYIKEYTFRAAFDGFRDSPYYQGKMDIWYGFACIGLDLLKENGIECFIAQNNWVTSAGASLLRKKVLAETRILIFTDFNDYRVFNTAGIQTMVYLLQKTKLSGSYNVRYSRLLERKISKLYLSRFLSFSKESPFARKFVMNFDIRDFEDSTISFNNPENSQILDSITVKSNFQLKESEVIQGIVPNPDVVNSRNLKKIEPNELRKHDIVVGDGVFVVKKGQLNTTIQEQESKYIKPLVEPTDVARYGDLSEFGKEILYLSKDTYNNDAPNLIAHLRKYRGIMDDRRENRNGRLDFFHLHWPRDKKFFERGSKILSVRKCDKPTFLYTEEEVYVMMSFNVIKTKRINLKYLTAILNSNLIEFWFRSKGKMQGSNFQIDKGPLLEMPLFKSDNQEPFVIFVDYLRFLQSQGFQEAKDKLIPVFFENILNGLVYELYFPELLAKFDRIISHHLGELPILKENMPPTEKLNVCRYVYDRLHNKSHPIRNNIFYMTSIPEIAIIEGKEV